MSNIEFNLIYYGFMIFCINGIIIAMIVSQLRINLNFPVDKLITIKKESKKGAIKYIVIGEFLILLLGLLKFFSVRYYLLFQLIIIIYAVSFHAWFFVLLTKYIKVKNKIQRIMEVKASVNKLVSINVPAELTEEKTIPDSYTQFSETELADLRISALQKNKKAALFLGKYYTETTADDDLAEYWYEIGAQNGSTECMFKLGQIMISKNDELEQIRGMFWLEKAVENGYTKE